MVRISITIVFLLHALLVAGALIGACTAIIALGMSNLRESVTRQVSSDVYSGSLLVQNNLHLKTLTTYFYSLDFLRDGDNSFSESESNFLPNSSKVIQWTDLYNLILSSGGDVLHAFEALREGDKWSVCGCRRNMLPPYNGQCQFSSSTLQRAVLVDELENGSFMFNFSTSPPLDLDMLLPQGSRQREILETVTNDHVHMDLPTPCIDCPSDRTSMLIPVSLCISAGSQGGAGKCTRALVTEIGAVHFAREYSALGHASDSTLLLFDASSQTVVLSNKPWNVGKNMSSIISPAMMVRIASMLSTEAASDVELSIEDLVLGAAAFTVGGLKLVHVQITPRSFYFSIINDQIQRASVIATPIFCFVCLLSVALFLAVRIPLKHVARDMTRASRMISAGTRTSTSLLFLKEVAEVDDASQLLHQRLIELKAFVPMNLFVESKLDNSDESWSQPPSHSELSIGKSSLGRESLVGNFPPNNPLTTLRRDRRHDDDEDFENASSVGTGAIEKIEAALQGVPSLTVVDEQGSPADEVSRSNESVPRHRHQQQHRRSKASANWALSAEVLDASEGRRFDVKCFTIMHISIGYDWTSLSKPDFAKKQRHQDETKLSTASDKSTSSITPILGSLASTRKDVVSEQVMSALHPIITSVCKCGGVLELLRPDAVIASFGAHVQYNAAHQLLAARCALMIRRMLPAATFNRSIIALDTGEYYVGTCGNSLSAARVVFGERFTLGRKISRLGHSELGRVVLTESIAVPLLEEFTIIPIDCVMTSEFPNPTTVYELLPRSHIASNKAFAANLARFKLAFSQMRTGRLLLAESTLMELKDDVYPHAERLATAIRAFRMLRGFDNMPYIRREQPAFEAFNTPLITAMLQHRAASPTDALSPPEELGLPQKDSQSSEDGTILKVETLRKDNSNAAALVSPQSPLRQPKDGEGTELPDTFEEERKDSAEGALFHMLDVQNSDVGEQPPDDGEPPIKITDKMYGTLTRSLDTIGCGSFSKVYRGLSATGTLVALKYINLSLRYINEADLVTEVNTACSLRHENIVNHMSWVVAGRFLIIIMEYVPGGSLKSILNGFGRLGVAAVRRYARDTLISLEYIHKHGIVHCDVKPQNLLMAMDGRCKLSDFGSCIAISTPNSSEGNTSSTKQQDQPHNEGEVEDPGSPRISLAQQQQQKENASSTQRDCFSVRGTAIYMAPEVARGEEPQFVSDIWSLGITVFELLTGTLPWQLVQGHHQHSFAAIGSLMKNDTMFLQHVCRGMVEARLDGPAAVLLEQEAPAVFDFLSQCLQSDPKDRPTSSDLLAHAMFL